MRSAARWPILALVVTALCTAPSTVAASRNVWSVAPDSTIEQSTDTTPDPIAPEPTDPEPSATDTTPDTTEPDDSVPSTSTKETLIAAGDPDDDVDTTTTAIAIVGFILLVAVASWWMVRRNNPDAEPMPRRDGQTGPPSDLI